MHSSWDELIDLDYIVLFSIDSPVGSWGKWMVEVRHSSGRLVAGYGENEDEAYLDVLNKIKHI